MDVVEMLVFAKTEYNCTTGRGDHAVLHNFKHEVTTLSHRHSIKAWPHPPSRQRCQSCPVVAFHDFEFCKHLLEYMKAKALTPFELTEPRCVQP